MDLYGTGVLFAFLIWITQLVLLFVQSQSQMAKNLKRVGLRQSWEGGRLVEIDPSQGFGWKVGKFLLFAIAGILSLLLSWLCVAWFLGHYFYNRSKQKGAPEYVRNFQWKLKNMDMSKEQIEMEIQHLKAAALRPTAAP